MSTFPPILSMPFIGCFALAKIATTDPAPGEPFGLSRKGKVISHALIESSIEGLFANTAPQEAMFVCYSRRDGGRLPRLTKATEGRIDVVCHWLFFDVDLNEMFGVKGKLAHTKLSPEQEAIRDQKEAAVMTPAAKPRLAS